MRIGALAQVSGLSTQTIRYYESIDLLPEPARTPSGYREYARRRRRTPALHPRRPGVRAHARRGPDAAVDEGRRDRDLLRTRCRSSITTWPRSTSRSSGSKQRVPRLLDLAERARRLDPAACTDPNRCQVIDRT